MFTSPNGTDDPAVKAAMEPFFAEVDKLDGVKVVSPYSPEGADVQQHDRSRSPSPSSASPSAASRRRSSLADKIQALGDQVERPPGLQIEYGGELFAEFELPASEILGILAAVIILLVAFGSVLAMGLPIGTALFGLGVGAGARSASSPTCSRCPSSRRRWRR